MCRRANRGSSSRTPPTFTSAPTRPSAASNFTGFRIPAKCAAGCGLSSHILSRPLDVSKFGLIYAGRAEEHRPGRADDRHRARRPDRPGAADHAVGVRLQAAGRQRFHVQHAADLRHLYRRAGVRVAEAAGRPGRRSRNATSPRPSCSTTIWTKAVFSSARSRSGIARA